MITTYSQIVWKVLSGIPIEVYDDVDHSVWENAVWELVVPRFEGDYSGKRTIGSANIISAYNLLHLKLLADSEGSEIDSFALFRASIDELCQLGLIRKRPEKVRESFRTV